MVKGKALLFGLNYAHIPSSTLNGCHNDVRNMSTYLEQTLKLPCQVYTDDVHRTETSAQGIVSKLYELAVQSFKENLEFVYIHYSGHGSYIRDRSGDELDGQDEALVPSDYQTAGLISDDVLQSVFQHFNPATRVVCVFDCCHSGTIGDVKYSWESPQIVRVENINCKVPAKLITLSGCLDTQTSADAYNVMGDSKYVGALTSCLLMVLKEKPNIDVFEMLASVRSKLLLRQFTQVPKLCSSFNLTKDTAFLPSA